MNEIRMNKTNIILDACSNHLGQWQLIEHMIKLAAECGADFIKFQAFDVQNLNIKDKFWASKYEYYKSVQLHREDYLLIMESCCKYNITPMFTVFNKELIPLLQEIGVKWVKIGSAEADNKELIQECHRKFQSLVISTGMNKTLYSYCPIHDQLILPNPFPIQTRANYIMIPKYLYCVSRYPCPYKDIDFGKMVLYDGFSDHTEGIQAAKKAIDLGAGFIEKHFTLSRYLPGNDQFFSITPDEAKELCDYRDYVWKCDKFKERWNK